MNAKLSFPWITSLAVLVLLSGIQTAHSGKWEPYKFRGNEKYEYRIFYNQSGKKVTAHFGLEIRKTGKTDENGQPLFEVTYTTRGTLPADKLGPEAAFGLWGVYGISLPILVLNPAYSFFFSQMELAVGEKMSFYGAGLVKVTGRQSIAGVNAYVCELYQQENKKMAEYWIDPDLALPAKSIVWNEDGAVQFEMELTHYSSFR